MTIVVRDVTGDGGVRLSVREHGDTGHGPTVVLVHGYPDNQRTWDLVVDRLAADHHVVTYDVRGFGRSAAPTDTSAYALRALVADLAAVVDAVSPDRPVHLVGHDWGSIQSWAAVTDLDAQRRFASFTSISGPSLDHAGRWIKAHLRPGKGRLRALAGQAARSSYIYAFHTPFPAFAWRHGLSRVWPELMARAEHAAPDADWPGPTFEDDAVRGIRLYRANMIPNALRPDESACTDVPVQLIVPVADAFVTEALLEGLDHTAPNLTVRRVGGRHWITRSKPDLVARWIREHITAVEAGEPTPAGSDRDVVIVTGAGSGIGRSVCLAFAERGAHVIATDLAGDRAEKTAQLCRLLGGTAEAHRLDVTDPEAIERMAERVAADHGAPTVVVNNAGLGMAGGSLDMTDKDWQQLLDVNLWGVIRGSREFAKVMIRNGTPGHIVNLASAAAFSPSRTLPGYATSKAAVLMFTESLRAELADDGIGVSAICAGFVDTGIATATRYVGVDAEHQAALRESADRAYKRRRVFPDTVADAVLRAVDTNKAVVPVAAEARFGLFVQRFAPRLRRALARVDLTPPLPPTKEIASS